MWLDSGIPRVVRLNISNHFVPKLLSSPPIVVVDYLSPELDSSGSERIDEERELMVAVACVKITLDTSGSFVAFTSRNDWSRMSSYRRSWLRSIIY
jgi:hypothetical protein